jgi:phosphoserine phosphatase
MSTPPGAPKSSGGGAEALFVDLDGTLIAGDLTWESLFLAIRQHPLVLFAIPFWVLLGRGTLKRKVAERATLQIDNLPYRPEVIEFLKHQKARGTEIILATASDRSIARRVADHLGLFTDYLGTEGGENLKGAVKLARMESYCRERGIAGFSYVGDTWADVPIWKNCRHVYAVAPSPALIAALKRLGGATPEILVRRPSFALPLLRALRPWHWIENLLLAVPPTLARNGFDVDRSLPLLVAFVAFSAAESAAYLAHDLMHLDVCRADPLRRSSALATGTLPVPFVPPLIAALLVVAFGISLCFLSLGVAGLLAVFFVACLCYATWLDRKPFLAGLMLAAMNVSRVLAGGLATDSPVSGWLLGFLVVCCVAVVFARRYLTRLKRVRS